MSGSIYTIVFIIKEYKALDNVKKKLKRTNEIKEQTKIKTKRKITKTKI
jgi:hypothetical protein